MSCCSLPWLFARLFTFSLPCLRSYLFVLLRCLFALLVIPLFVVSLACLQFPYLLICTLVCSHPCLFHFLLSTALLYSLLLPRTLVCYHFLLPVTRLLARLLACSHVFTFLLVCPLSNLLDRFLLPGVFTCMFAFLFLLTFCLFAFLFACLVPFLLALLLVCICSFVYSFLCTCACLLPCSFVCTCLFAPLLPCFLTHWFVSFLTCSITC